MMLEDVLEGLANSPRRIPCKYFYDPKGSRLFEQICELPEYYLTRTELAIMKENLPVIVRLFAPGFRFVELGSGSGVKTRLIFDALMNRGDYLPVDLAAEQLTLNAKRLGQRYPGIHVQPVVADYEFLRLDPKENTIVYFPGSTIGNLEPMAVRTFLGRMAELIGKTGAMIIGVDRKKDPAVLHRAYNDSGDLTAAFNLNLLRRINTELGANFDLDGFYHHAPYSPGLGCIEMFLISKRKQSVSIGDRTFTFADGEVLRTERSYKYSPTEFADLCQRTGLSIAETFTDADQLFSVYVLRAG